MGAGSAPPRGAGGSASDTPATAAEIFWVLLLHLPAPFAVSPGIAWGQSQPPVGPSKKPFPRSGRKVSLLLLARQAEVGRGSGCGYRRNDIMFQWESQKCSLQSVALAPSPSHSCVML